MAAAAITLLTSGSQALTGTGGAVDVSNNAQVRMTIATGGDVDAGLGPDLEVWFLTAPAASGPWREIERIRMSSGLNTSYPWSSLTRVVLPDADNFLKVAWRLRYDRGALQSFTLGVAGTGVVSA